MEIYIATEGDTYASVAGRFGVDEGYLRSVNGADSGEPALGQAIVIPSPERTVTVREGDTLYGIAEENGMSVYELFRLNPALGGRTELYPGQVLVLSLGGEKRGRLETNGYAYTSADESLLRRVLPYMSYLTVFTYGFTPEGELLEPEGEERLISLCREYATAPVMMISTLTSEGTFSNQLSNALFSNPAATEVLTARLVDRAEEMGYYGIDVDFEYVFPSDADGFTAFVSSLTEAANERGLRVWVALAPKSYAEQPGLLYEAHNYAELGAAADFATLMTYEWGYRYGPPMAVAPLDKVRVVVEYAVTEISADKIFMGVPCYGYDWTLPYVRGVSVAPSIGCEEAVMLAYDVGAEIRYDTVSQAPYFRYIASGAEHEVWFGDARSAQASYALAAQFGLRGTAFWNLMRPYTVAWTVAESEYDIVRPLETAAVFGRTASYADAAEAETVGEVFTAERAEPTEYAASEYAAAEAAAETSAAAASKEMPPASGAVGGQAYADIGGAPSADDAGSYDA